MSRLPLRYAWSHQGDLHRRVVRAGNSALNRVPTGPKYRAMQMVNRNRIPYRLVTGSTVVQVGAPFDTLGAGRSRAAHFGFAIGAGGHLVVIEPHPPSAARFEEFASEQLECTTTVINSAAWSEPTTVTLHVDEDHPATNFSHPDVNYDAERLADYSTIEIAGDTVDTLLGSANVDGVDLLSITTNWAEREILAGAHRTLATARYCSLALGPGDELYDPEMRELGFAQIGFDDRGATYEATRQ